MASVNERLLDMTIHHSAVDLMRVESSLQKKVLKELRVLEKNIIRELAVSDPTGPVRTAYQQKRLEALLQQTKNTIRRTYSSINSDQGSDLKKMAKAEMLWAESSFNAALTANVVSVAVNKELLESLTGGALVQGKYPKQWWGRQAGEYAHKFETEMRQGVLRGETIGQLTARVRRIQPTVRRHAEAQVRTSFQTVAQEARKAAYRQFEDVLKGYQYVATLDSRTTPFCQGADGTIFNTDFKVKNGPSWVTPPPLHWNCRSTIVPLTKSWEELGGKTQKKIPEETRASIDGQVPATQTYTQWLRGKSPEFQDNVLGPARAKLFRSGGITHLSQLLSRRGDVLTVDELLAKVEAGTLASMKHVPFQGYTKRAGNPNYVYSPGEVEQVHTPSGDLLIEFGTTSKKFQQKMIAYVESLPAGLKERLAQNKVKFVFTHHMSEARPELKGVRPRGWSEGFTWDDAGAGYITRDKQVVIAEKIGNPKTNVWADFTRTESAFYHETGHAIDKLEGYTASLTAEFIDAYDADKAVLLAKGGNLDIAYNQYFLQKGVAGYSEAYAQAVRYLLGPKSSTEGAKRFQTWFKKTSTAVEKGIKQLLGVK